MVTYGLQVKTPFGILQIVYSLEELHCTLRKHLTDRFPPFEHSVPINENHRFNLLAAKKKVGYLIVDADSYGEVEVYQSDELHIKLREHHESKGLTVIDLGDVELQEWNTDADKVEDIKTCNKFEHSVEPHLHVCKDDKNITKRCPYSKEEVATCPLFSKFEVKQIELTKVIETEPSGEESKDSKPV